MTEERKPSRWERMRLNLVVPIGVVVAVAVICVVVAVLTSAVPSSTVLRRLP